MELQLWRALSIALRTTPFAIYRAAAYGAMCACVFLYVAMLGLIGSIFGVGAFWLLVGLSVVFATALGLWGLAGRLMAYFIDSGHTALIAEFAANPASAPMGVRQIGWAREQMTSRFDGPARFSGMIHRLNQVLRDVNRKLFDVSVVAPLADAGDDSGLAHRITDLTLPYLDGCILGYVFQSADNTEEAAKKGILLYCSYWKALLKNAIWLTLLGYGFTLAAGILLMIPMGVAAAMATSASVRFVLFLSALFLAIAAKWVLYDPVANAAMTAAFLEDADISPPDLEWEDKIRTVSEVFRDWEG